MIKKFILCTALIALISGCGDNKKTEETKEIIKVENTQTPLKIEVEENSNANEIKVTPKIKDGSKNESYYYDYNVKSEYDPNAKPANEDAAVREKEGKPQEEELTNSLTSLASVLEQCAKRK